MEEQGDMFWEQLGGLRSEGDEKKLAIAVDLLTQEFLRGFVDADVFLGKRQQVDFAFLPQQGVLLPSRELSQPAILIISEVRGDVDCSIVTGRGADRRVSGAETGLAACGVYLL